MSRTFPAIFGREKVTWSGDAGPYLGNGLDWRYRTVIAACSEVSEICVGGYVGWVMWTYHIQRCKNYRFSFSSSRNRLGQTFDWEIDEVHLRFDLHFATQYCQGVDSRLYSYKRDLLTIPVDNLNKTDKCPEIPAFEDLHSYLVFDQSNELRKVKYKISIPNNADISGALFILKNQYEHTQTQCKEGARDENIVW